jgi:quercetin dioxygenase-like cupin family protein
MTVLQGHYDKGATLPRHAHPHEQITWVLGGSVRIVTDGGEVILGAGEMAHIPGGVPHEATALANAEIAEMFSPVREDLRQS